MKHFVRWLESIWPVTLGMVLGLGLLWVLWCLPQAKASDADIVSALREIRYELQNIRRALEKQ